VTELELWSIREVAAELGASSTGSARHTLSRWGVKAVRYEPGPSGRAEARYDPTDVRAAAERAPGRGVRTDLAPKDG
jgi:hypothetical protein